MPSLLKTTELYVFNTGNLATYQTILLYSIFVMFFKFVS